MTTEERKQMNIQIEYTDTFGVNKMTNHRIILDFDIPEGATHLERHGKNIGFFWKNIDGQWFYYGNGSNEWHALDLLTTAHIIPIEFEVLK